MLDLTPLLRLRAGRRRARLAQLDAAAVQEATLLRLVRMATRTAFGRAHGFGAVASVADYQRNVPLRRYEDFWDRWWRPSFPYYQNSTWPGLIPFLAETAGTATGATKYLPVSYAMLQSNRAAARDTLAFHLEAYPKSRVLGGYNLLLGGSPALRRRGPGVRSGELGGIAAATMPAWARAHTWPPPDVAGLPDWNDKLDRIASDSLNRDIRSISGMPNAMLALFERFAAKHPNRPRSLARLFPRLELIVHGGVGFAPYQATFDAWLEGSGAEHREIYTAGEGYIAAADRGPGEGLRLMLDHGLFMEFIPIEEVGSPRPRRAWIGNAEPGGDYALAITSNAGLWSMLIGDRVRLLGLDPPRVTITGRLGHELSLCGEQVTGAELDRAIAAAATATGCSIAEYTCHAFLTGDGRGRHLFAIEAAGGSIEPNLFAHVLDSRLREGNRHYATRRFGDVQLLPPLIRVMPPGSFISWLARRNKRGGQNKVPRVITDESALALLLGLQPDALRLVFAAGAG